MIRLIPITSVMSVIGPSRKWNYKPMEGLGCLKRKSVVKDMILKGLELWYEKWIS